MEKYLSEGNVDGSYFNWFRKYKKIWKLNLEKHRLYPLLIFVASLVAAIYWAFGVDKAALLRYITSTLGIVFLFKILILYMNQKTKAIGLLNKYFSQKNYGEYLGIQAEVEKELENLVKTWIPKPNENENKNEKIFLFIDDIDRCNVDKIVEIIDGLRVILDNPEIHNRLLIITAIDENILKKAIRVKYKRFCNDEIELIFKEYLEKIFIIGIKLNKLEVAEITEFLEKTISENSMLINNKSAETIDIENIDDESILNNHNEKDSPVERGINDVPPAQISKEDLDLKSEEREYLILSISNLNNATPRKIKIFYYKYLILKQLFHVRLNENNLILEWEEHGDEKVIMDILIHVSNDHDLKDFVTQSSNSKIMDTLKYTTNMVSIL